MTVARRWELEAIAIPPWVPVADVSEADAGGGYGGSVASPAKVLAHLLKSRPVPDMMFSDADRTPVPIAGGPSAAPKVAERLRAPSRHIAEEEAFVRAELGDARTEEFLGTRPQLPPPQRADGARAERPRSRPNALKYGANTRSVRAGVAVSLANHGNQ